jgi:hypothetical protein
MLLDGLIVGIERGALLLRIIVGLFLVLWIVRNLAFINDVIERSLPFTLPTFLGAWFLLQVGLRAVSSG